MSIYAYVGLPGSGKSYNSVENVIVPALREGRRVVTNIPLNRDAISHLPDIGSGGELVNFPVTEVAQDPELIRKYVEAGDVFVLDEVWRLWPQGLKSNEVPEAFKSLLAEHRHMLDAQGRSVHICLVTQDLGLIAPFARKLVEQTFVHTKMGHMGAEGRFRVDIYQASMTGVVGSEKNRIRQIFGTYKKEVWELYQSHTMAKSPVGGAVQERAIDRRGNVLKKPFFTVFLPLMVVGACVAAWRLKTEGDRLMHPKPEVKPVRSVAHPGFEDSEHRPERGFLASAMPESRPVYKVLGFIEVPGDPARSKALLLSPSGVKVARSMSHCRFLDGDYFECEVDGVWYGSVGESLGAHEEKAVPVSLPAGTQFNAPISGIGVAAQSVASAAPDSSVDAVNEDLPRKPGEVAVLSGNRGGAGLRAR